MWLNSLHESISPDTHSIVSCRVICTSWGEKKEDIRRQNDKHFIFLLSGEILWPRSIPATSGCKAQPLRFYHLAHSDIPDDDYVHDFRVQHFLEAQSSFGNFQHGELDSGGYDGKNCSNTKTFFFHLPQFIPNATIFFIVLVTAERSRLTIQSVGQLVHALDQKLKLFHVSFAGSHRRIKRLSLFASFRNKFTKRQYVPSRS